MTAFVDTSVLIDVLRGVDAAMDTIVRHRRQGRIHASEVTRTEVLAGMRSAEEHDTRSLLATLRWHDLDETVSEEAGRLGRRWLPSHSGIDSADLIVAATARLLGAELLTGNVRHFPMFEGLAAPY